MRLRSEVWVKWYVRQAASSGCPAYVAHHGDDTAGAVIIKVNRLNGTADLYTPAPPSLDSTVDPERRFQCVTGPAPVAEAEADKLIEREARFDSDLWVVEVESPAGAHFLDGWLLATPR